ncbi:cardiolipin synthase [Thermaerobacillus caldiproteolyticus]|uniref:cardiolipin synthase n=1 Tax=Thermaerobacillus caldiproteolyticus TaxID=247480 RepID=UPI00188DAF05|nr:cardiolipin synthase [Anoxybacillus caldiproteolyticus]QPA30862.1 cardiolipin synthase [Anoxybacillus caldiproteolyticus]
MVVLLLVIIILALIMLDEKLGEKMYQSKRMQTKYPRRHSDFSFFMSGPHLFSDYFQTIREANHHIHVLFYIVKTDEISQQFFDLLKQKVQEGVEVRLLVDWVGGFELPKKMIRSLEESGIQFAYAHKPTFPFFLYKLNRRNHRKITVIDGRIGYIGGFNIGKEYIDQDPDFGEWRDYHLKMTGEGVNDLQAQFCHDWKEATKEQIKGKKYFPTLPKGAISHQLIATNGHSLEQKFIRFIHQAKQEIIIGTPYFIPGHDVMKALLEALQRGVSVTILVPLKADHPFVKEAAFPYFYRLLKEGAHIYQFYQGFYHAKIMVIDGECCDIGTANFDKRSFFLNSEIHCYIYDQKFVQQVKNAIQQDLARSERLTLDFWRHRTIWQRGKESISTLISGWL